MKQARYKEPLPLAVIEAARAGDAGAVEQVLQYYNGYINKLCTRTIYDDCGQLHVCVDEYMKHRLENKLIYQWPWSLHPIPKGMAGTSAPPRSSTAGAFRQTV